MTRLSVRVGCARPQKSYLAIVTGATGYIGGHLVKQLLEEGHEVCAILRTTSHLDNLPITVRNHRLFHAYRYASYEDVREIFRSVSSHSTRIIVYHLAAWVLSGSLPYEDIPQLINSNLTFGTMVAAAASDIGVAGFVSTGTYWQYYGAEHDCPVNLYAAAKQAYMDLLRYYEDAGTLHAITLILYDTYGPALGEVRRAKLLDYLRDHADENVSLAMSPGEQRMNYVYIDDVIRAYCHAGEILDKGQYNLCGTYAVRGEQEISLRELVEMYLQQRQARIHIDWGGKPYRKREVMVPDHHIPVLPGWKAEVALADGLARMD